MRGLGHPRRGTALLVAIVFAVLLASLGLFLLAPIRAGKDYQVQESLSLRTRTLARGGLETAVYLLRTGDPETAAEVSLIAPHSRVLVTTAPVEGHDGVWSMVCTVTCGDRGQDIVQVVHAAVRLGPAPEGEGLRPVQAFVQGRTPDVLQSLP
jgi:hypothetical protein